MAEERSLADPAPAPPIVDRSPEVTPETFDLEAFLAGVRPTRRSVKLFPHAHLIGVLDKLVSQIEGAPDDANVDDLIDEFDRVKAQFQTGVWFTVEKRSDEWIHQFRKQASGRYKDELKSADDHVHDRAEALITVEQLVEQIVEPAGVTFEQLMALEESNEDELTKLMGAMINANTSRGENSQVLTRDFSDRRSATRS